MSEPKPTGRKRTREELISLERERMHREMLSAVSHDLKTPLASIIGSLEICEKMKGKLSPEKQQILLSTALEEAYRLNNFITNILDMAKLENAMIAIRSEKCYLEESINDCITRTNNRSDNSVTSVIAKDGDIVLMTDPILLCRAISLLLENAFKYGGNPAIITTEFGKSADGIYIRVSDNGAGIPPEKHEEIFNKYIRITRTDHQKAGTGLGLAIVRAIMNLIGGTVSVANHEKGGAEFTLLFPHRLEAK